MVHHVGLNVFFKDRQGIQLKISNRKKKNKIEKEKEEGNWGGVLFVCDLFIKMSLNKGFIW
ncbi:rCG61175, partial [Rattus norvegicus]